MTPELYQSALTTGASCNLSTRAKWRLTGADRVRYLNGQVTQDVRLANARATLHACVTNVKGKIEGDIFIHTSADGQSLLVDADAGLRDSLGMRLERYIIADDVTLEDITDEWQLWHLLGDISAPENSHTLINDQRFAHPGRDLWIPISVSGLLPVPTLTDSDTETLRILQQVPAYPHELNPEAFPQEAGLESSVMSFTKGCYIGQEILSRIKTTGKMPRQLVAWNTSSPVSAGELLFNEEGKELGHITSVTQHPVNSAFTGLAYVRQNAAEAEGWKTISGVLLQKLKSA